MRSSSTSRSSPREHHRISSFGKMDPLKSSILASSQRGWTQSPASPSATSPLRISKRDAESIAPSLASLLPKNANHSGVTRRSSSSYNHMRNRSLVSKSVFKSSNADSHQPDDEEYLIRSIIDFRILVKRNLSGISRSPAVLKITPSPAQRLPFHVLYR
ncbi:hypothetical protein FRC02_008201 [Tulasnella sp. 418]|nr:hypothetical protein FRC02_008201 [Tulasnella sp. 418]